MQYLDFSSFGARSCQCLVSRRSRDPFGSRPRSRRDLKVQDRDQDQDMTSQDQDETKTFVHKTKTKTKTIKTGLETVSRRDMVSRLNITANRPAHQAFHS